MAAGFGMLFGIVIFRLQNVFGFLIEGVLHKGLSFTGRTELWDLAIEKILKYPWLGCGYAHPTGKVYRLAKGKYYNAHNVFLEVLLEGGILAAVPFVLMLAIVTNQLMRFRKTETAAILSSALLALALVTSMEEFLDSGGILIYGLLFFAYHIGTIINGKDTPPISSS